MHNDAQRGEGAPEHLQSPYIRLNTLKLPVRYPICTDHLWMGCDAVRQTALALAKLPWALYKEL